MDIKKVNQFYTKNKQGKLANKVIIEILSNEDEIVTGAKAINKQLPIYLQKHTEDWDIFTDDKPEVVAKKIEKQLDKKYGGNYFYVEPALHEGTYKIKAIANDDTIADISIVNEPITYSKIGKINYATLDFLVHRIKVTLAEEGKKFRHLKDSNALQRIVIAESIQSKHKSKKKKVVRTRIPILKGVR